MVSREENWEKFYSFVCCRSCRFVSVSLDRCSSSEKALKTCLYLMGLLGNFEKMFFYCQNCSIGVIKHQVPPYSQELFHILTGMIKLAMKILVVVKV